MAEKNLQTTANTLEGQPLDPLDHDGDGKKGGSVPGRRVKKGAPLPSADELGEDPKSLVVVRITVKGHGKVHDGETIGGRYDANDEVELPLVVAKGLQERGFAEIVGVPG